MRAHSAASIALAMGVSITSSACGPTPNGLDADGQANPPDDATPTRDALAPVDDSGDAGGALDASAGDASPPISEACVAVLAALGEGVVGDAGLTADYVSRATACGFRLAAFDRRSTTARWQVRWRFGADASGRYRIDASRVIAAGDRLLVALLDTAPMSANAEITVVADDPVFCQTVTYTMRWPAVGDGMFATLPGATAVVAPVPDADVAQVCRHGRVYRINVQPAPELARNITPFGELLTGAGGSRRWSASTLVDRDSASQGFAIAISTRYLTAGSTPRFTFAGARTMIGTECRDVNLILDFSYDATALPAAATWTIGTRAQDPSLCSTRSTTIAVTDGYLLVN